MGGSEALLVGLNHPKQFAWVGAFSAGIRGTNYASRYPGLDASANRQLRLLWIGCGEQDGLMAPNESFDQWLESQGIHHRFVRTPGQHSFRVWRRYLAEFAPLLFQPAK